MSLASCSIDDNTTSRRRIPVHYVLDYYKMLFLKILKNNKNRIKKRRQLEQKKIIQKNSYVKYEDILCKALFFSLLFA